MGGTPPPPRLRTDTSVVLARYSPLEFSLNMKKVGYSLVELELPSFLYPPHLPTLPLLLPNEYHNNGSFGLANPIENRNGLMTLAPFSTSFSTVAPIHTRAIPLSYPVDLFTICPNCQMVWSSDWLLPACLPLLFPVLAPSGELRAVQIFSSQETRSRVRAAKSMHSSSRQTTKENPA